MGHDYSHDFKWTSWSHRNKQIPDGLFFAEQVAYSVLLNVFRIWFPTSLFITVIHSGVQILLVFYLFQLQKKLNAVYTILPHSAMGFRESSWSCFALCIYHGISNIHLKVTRNEFGLTFPRLLNLDLDQIVALHSLTRKQIEWKGSGII